MVSGSEGMSTVVIGMSRDGRQPTRSHYTYDKWNNQALSSLTIYHENYVFFTSFLDVVELISTTKLH